MQDDGYRAVLKENTFKMKTTYRIIMLLMIAVLTQATQCEEDLPELRYTMSEDRVPQEPYLTTIATDYFKSNIVNYGWKWKESWRIGEDGISVRYYATTESDFIPNDLYFGKDSMTVFQYKKDCNLRRTGSYTYNAANNQVLSNAIDYMQVTHVDSAKFEVIERLGRHYYKSCYERMVPYEVNARWNGSKLENP